MAEIDDNLAHADLGALDLAVFLAERKTVYERMYPQTTAEAFKGNRHTGSLAADMMSFARSVADQRDMSERQIRRLVAAGQGLDRATVAQLRAAPAKVTLADLQTLAKCGDAEDRAAICTALAAGSAKSAKAALDARHAQPGHAHRSPIDKQHIAFKEGHLSVEHDGSITWDQLQAIKCMAWGDEARAIEVYPAQGQLVNSRNMRHLWRLGPNDFCPDLLGDDEGNDSLQARHARAWAEARG